MDNRVEQHASTCVGCSACMNICPKQAINMQYDGNGFFYPSIENAKCIQCGLCESVCQIYHPKEIENYHQHGYIAIVRDRAIYSNAASGGAFGGIATAFLEKYPEGYVVGAAYANSRVSHIVINKKEEISKLQNSKYVQSDMGFVHKEVRSILESGKEVLFSGTPCQVQSLKFYLKKDYDKLYTLDLICHGVPSPLFLRRDLEQYGTNIDNLKFRFKKKHSKSRSGFILSLTSNGKNKYVLCNRDPYYSLFMQNKSFRDSCYQCEFADLDRIGDITIGDCDSHNLYPQFHEKEATSTIIVNNRKGELLWNIVDCMFDFSELDLSKEAHANTQLSKPSQKPDNWDEILSETQHSSIVELRRKYAKPDNLKGKLLKLKNVYLP